ncbi:MAG: hydroxyacid dehydrogenase [Actinobacteria bacterium]|nr:hydroxyacid dehydrogenase [Actinomycetota bacterium]NIS34210.1 hydroxyacid dehydrogenase [Actinomycetota bacterium]NIT97308.1 hydroxyacid dehydrogenase [Actinomycetota bacterium]NIU20988.1 hydroxyacid dehydrogenase [Actinomycetota bacterium]NIU68983.1 hydroxyacid dehydrogenase [Actinomycetota bacterium]
MRVFLTHNPEDLEAYYGRARPGLEAIAEVVTNPLDRDLTTAELIDHASGCDVIVAHRATPGEAGLFRARPELLAFLRCAVDISTVDVEAANDAGVLVARADKSFVASTAELALALLLDALRHVSDSTVDFRAGRMPPQRPGRQLRGKTAGIIGYGAIGSYLADVLAAMGVDVLVHDPHVDRVATGVRVEFAELLARSDIVLPLAPAGPATENLIDEAALAAMKPGALLVNVSRGELLDEHAVGAALDEGRLGGLAIDVGRAPDQRPSPELAARPGVVATPHLGGLTPENADAQARSSVEQVAAMLAGEMPPRSVNPEHATRLRAHWATAS